MQTIHATLANEIKTGDRLFFESFLTCSLYAVIGEKSKGLDTVYFITWEMVSTKTGSHAIITTQPKLNVISPDKRVIAHWEGFKQNQFR